MHRMTFRNHANPTRRFGAIAAASVTASGLTLGLTAVAFSTLGSATAAVDAAGASAPVRSDAWTGAWASGQQELTETTFGSAKDTTLRLLVHPTTGGSSVRVRLANTFGDDDVVIGSASVARRILNQRPFITSGGREQPRANE